MLESVKDTVTALNLDWTPRPHHFRERMLNKKTVAGPNGRPWTYLKALAGTQGAYLCDWLHHLDSGRPAPTLLTEHDRYLALNKPLGFQEGEPIYDAGSFRDISVGNVEVRVLEVVAALPVTSNLDKVVHQDNVGWVPGRTILRPVHRANQKVWERRGDQQDWAALLLDFLRDSLRFDSWPCGW